LRRATNVRSSRGRWGKDEPQICRLQPVFSTSDPQRTKPTVPCPAPPACWGVGQQELLALSESRRVEPRGLGRETGKFPASDDRKPLLSSRYRPSRSRRLAGCQALRRRLGGQARNSAGIHQRQASSFKPEGHRHGIAIAQQLVPPCRGASPARPDPIGRVGVAGCWSSGR